MVNLKELYFNKLKKGLVTYGYNSLRTIISNLGEGYIELVITKYRSKGLESLVQNLNDKIIVNPSFIKSFDKKNVQVVVILKESARQYEFPKLKNFLTEKVGILTGVAVHSLDYEDNLGNIIRTAFAMKVDFILVSNSMDNVYSPTVGKISVGANYCIPIYQENFFAGLKILRSNGFEVIGLDLKGENIMDLEYNEKVCFALGRENEGVSDSLASFIDATVSIPINKTINSLNVSNAFAMAIYDRNLKCYVKT